MMNLFTKGQINIRSGKSDFKIECDALTDKDLNCIAHLIIQNVPFGSVVSVPTGGDRLKKALEPACHSSSENILIVDDVLTTGKSMEDMKRELGEDEKVIGVVIFARGKCPDWVEPLFQMWDK